MFPSRNSSPSQILVSSRGPQCTPGSPRSMYRNQALSNSPYPTRPRCLVSRESPLAFSANSPLTKLILHDPGNESSLKNIEPRSDAAQNPYQTPQHRHHPAYTPLRVRRMRKKIHLKENCEIGGYGARRLFKEEILGMDQHSVTHVAKEAIKNVFECGASHQN